MSYLLLVKPTTVVLVKLFFQTLHILYNYMLKLTKLTISEQKIHKSVNLDSSTFK